MKEKYSPAVMADWDGIATSLDEAQGNYNSNGTDNANDALKETATTWEKHHNNLRNKNMPEISMKK
eukprot:CAMPEP_0172306714 /NCGR_PEP_ID=MMETSP1058-20130122/7729_1 /TAXON_ID=83371 /ORGANISM="Detonula confervacea, Strain CCMP 353" /LENGTH=65 /DNA_ID=CAMNT_0013018685 /DNA_START=311 /DNA_END=505 /DNA_ORIENTATION=-